jgi:hypothetical protein
MYNVPEGVTTTECGLLKLATAAAPSTLPAVPEPVNVDTLPLGETARILWLPESTT